MQDLDDANKAKAEAEGRMQQEQARFEKASNVHKQAMAQAAEEGRKLESRFAEAMKAADDRFNKAGKQYQQELQSYKKVCIGYAVFVLTMLLPGKTIGLCLKCQMPFPYIRACGWRCQANGGHDHAYGICSMSFCNDVAQIGHQHGA